MNDELKRMDLYSHLQNRWKGTGSVVALIIFIFSVLAILLQIGIEKSRRQYFLLKWVSVCLNVSEEPSEAEIIRIENKKLIHVHRTDKHLSLQLQRTKEPEVFEQKVETKNLYYEIAKYQLLPAPAW